MMVCCYGGASFSTCNDDIAASMHDNRYFKVLDELMDITGSTELHKRMRFWFVQEIAKEEGLLKFLRDRCDESPCYLGTKRANGVEFGDEQSVESESFESSTQHPSVNEFVVINIPEEDVEPKQIILDPDDQPMWESAKTVAPTPNSAIVQIDVDDNFVINNEPTQGILDITAGGIFLYKTPNQAFQFLDDKVLFEHDWPIKSKNEHHRNSVSFADGSDSNTNNSRFMEKLKDMDSQIISLNEELQDIRNKYNELREGNTSKNHMNDDTPMCERHEVNSIQSKGYQNRNSQDSYSPQSIYNPNDSEKSLTELNNVVTNDLEDFKRRIRSMRTVHDKLFTRDDGKTTGVLPNKESKIVNQEPQSKTDFEKSITKFLDGQRVTNMFFRNNINDMILKIKQNEKNFQIKIKKMERKMDE
ncbi:hypothetical protein Tco_0599612 [Tanacetum coccineum]